MIHEKIDFIQRYTEVVGAGLPKVARSYAYYASCSLALKLISCGQASGKDLRISHFNSVKVRIILACGTATYL